ncbi:helix-turn-helix domain-containing protein [Mycoplana dimorpha]|uniref:Helix-turn-helix protein n=1 Tax=Mycoplana dimorpha TaxID=28320 RepID=A0A2T5B0U6_MYCDI|nr:helix-turn-helix transcriptional regulator [Mycoplana dimorpha]PTM92592.1 helix-turn-helix protein [Mycoplana dimorpha]
MYNDTLAPRASFDAAYDTIGGRISLARDAVGLSVDEASAVTGVTTETWSNWENDRAAPRANRLDMLARILQVSIAWLLHGQGTGPR